MVHSPADDVWNVRVLVYRQAGVLPDGDDDDDDRQQVDSCGTFSALRSSHCSGTVAAS